MRRTWSLLLAACAACPAPPATDAGPDASAPGAWRSSLYPADWTPAFTDDAGRFLHDFSYAGYAHGAREPLTPAAPSVRVETDGGDMTAALQAAIDALPDGGLVQLGAGRFRVDGQLFVRRSGVVIAGAGTASTRLVFTKSVGLSNAENVLFGGTARTAGEWPLAEDGRSRAFSVRVAPSPDAGALLPGDDVALGHVITDAYVADHGMTGFWSAFNGTWQPFALRTVVAVAPDGTVTLDVPLRADELVRDGASLRRLEGLVREVGLEDLSFTNAVEPGAAYAATQVHVVTLSGVVDGWVRRVSSFSEDGGLHVQSGGVRVHQSNRVTVADVQLARAQHRGGGGNGYLFEVRQSSEVLYRDCTGDEGRHNFIENWGFGTSGCVWLRVHSRGGFATATAGGTRGGVGYSEFHHSLATANLVDSSTFDDGFSIVNRRLESSGAGHTGTENAFWNVAGAGLLRSMQWRWGYVVGTRDLEVATDEVFIAEGTAPRDFVEGLDAGATLEPASLYEDQRRRRLGR